MMRLEDIRDVLGTNIPVLGVIPESRAVLQASNTGAPIILEPQSDAGAAYVELVGRYLGELDPQAPVRMERGFFGRLFGG
jgi:septum site-determining protein MinD